MYMSQLSNQVNQFNMVAFLPEKLSFVFQKKRNVIAINYCGCCFFLNAATFEESISVVAETARPILLEIFQMLLVWCKYAFLTN